MTDTPIQEQIGLTTKLNVVLHEEMGSLQPRFLLIRLITGLIPQYVGARVRTRILRAAGLNIGYGTIMMATPHIHGSGNIRTKLKIGAHVMLNVGCFFDVSAPITISDHASLGHEVMILTSSHEIGDERHRAGPLTTAPVKVGEGAWIGARSIILPGITIGAGSIIGAGAIVNRDIPPNTLAGGVPAKIIKHIED